MSVIENKNFTNFQNVNVKGTDSHAGAIRLEAVGGDGKTISIVQGNKEAVYLSFADGIRLGSGHISLQSLNTEGTLSFSPSPGAARAWALPDVTGALSIAGTVAVQLPQVTGTPFHSTIVTVAGITVKDVVTAQLSFPGGAYDPDNSTFYIMNGVTAQAGALLLHFYNPGNATGYTEAVVNYVATNPDRS